MANTRMRFKDEKLKLVTVHLPPMYIEILKEFVSIGLYPNVAEAIRNAVLNQIHREMYRMRSQQPQLSPHIFYHG